MKYLADQKYTGSEENIDAEILYRGSDNGWEPLDFHKCVYDETPTVSLFKIENGDCVGGFTY